MLLLLLWHVLQHSCNANAAMLDYHLTAVAAGIPPSVYLPSIHLCSHYLYPCVPACRFCLQPLPV
jgi:hypothetical protein